MQMEGGGGGSMRMQREQRSADTVGISKAQLKKCMKQLEGGVVLCTCP
jgi:hypothetical protein